jgi:NAD(P)H dehydrogenase (quinone)
MTIGISGASGQLGRLTADLLLERIEPGELVLVTRDPDGLDGYAGRGVAVRRGNFDDPASLPEAYSGVETLLLISCGEVGRRIAQHTAAIEAAGDAGVRRVVYTGIVNPTEANPAAVVEEHAGTEEALRASGLDWTMLRNGIYADLQLPGVQQAIASGRHVHNGGDGTVAYVARADCAAVAAEVLAGSGHENKAYDVTGPELVSGADFAALASERGGVPVEAVAVDDETYVAGLVEHAGLPEPVAQFLATFGRAAREGQLAVRSDDVETLTGRRPQSLGDLLDGAG